MYVYNCFYYIVIWIMHSNRYIWYSPEVTLHLLETFFLLLAQVSLNLAIYQVESISFWLKNCSTLSDVGKLSKVGYFHWKLLVTMRCYIVHLPTPWLMFLKQHANIVPSCFNHVIFCPITCKCRESSRIELASLIQELQPFARSRVPRVLSRDEIWWWRSLTKVVLACTMARTMRVYPLQFLRVT